MIDIYKEWDDPFDYETLQERLRRPKRVNMTESLYKKIRNAMFVVYKNLELLDFIDQEPVMKWLLSRVTNSTKWGGASSWDRHDPNDDWASTTELRLLDGETLRWWEYHQLGSYARQVIENEEFGWFIDTGDMGDPAALGRYYYDKDRHIGRALNIDRICSVLQLSAHDIAEAHRLFGRSADKG
jgi:hypothetical protein